MVVVANGGGEWWWWWWMVGVNVGGSEWREILGESHFTLSLGPFKRVKPVFSWVGNLSSFENVLLPCCLWGRKHK